MSPAINNNMTEMGCQKMTDLYHLETLPAKHIQTHEPGIYAEKIPDFVRLESLIFSKVFFRDCI